VCVLLSFVMLAASYTVYAFSSLTPTSQMKCPGDLVSPLKSAMTPDIMQRLNWMINTYYIPTRASNPTCTLPVTVSQGTYQSKTTTAPGTYREANKWDMQSAVWALTGNNRYAGNIISTDGVVNCMLYNAYNHNIGTGYTPPCNGTLAVVIVPCSTTTPSTYTAQATIAQVLLSSLPVPCECKVSLE